MPQTDLRLALIPIDIKPGLPEANLDYAEATIGSLATRPDLVVLPEMCATGYTLDAAQAHQWAEAPDGYSMTRLRAMARRFDAALCGSLSITDDGGRLFNRAFFLGPDGTEAFYDKRHLFVLGSEPELYTPGRALPPVIPFRGWQIMPAVCYDLRFPVWNRRTPERPYDLLLFPANWPESRSYAWRQLLIARAIENQACVAGCNRLGRDDYGSYSPADTLIYDQWGADISDRSSAGAVTAVLSGPALDHSRSRFPNLAAADPFDINIK